MILLTSHSTEEHFCELTGIQNEEYERDLTALTTVNILSLWTFYLIWTCSNIHFVLVAKQYIKDPIPSQTEK